MGLSCTKDIRLNQERLNGCDSAKVACDQYGVFHELPAEPIAAWRGAFPQGPCQSFPNALQYTQLQLSLHRDHPWTAYWRTLAYMVVAADIKTAERLVEQGVMPSSILLRARKALTDWRRSSFILAELEWLEENLKANKERSSLRRESPQCPQLAID